MTNENEACLFLKTVPKVAMVLLSIFFSVLQLLANSLLTNHRLRNKIYDSKSLCV